MQIKNRCLFVFLIIFFASCASQKVSIIESYKYDESTRKTNYTVLPYGSVDIPGKWDKKGYNSVSRQQFFTNADSVILAVAFNRFDQYEFNEDGKYKNMDFVETFYKWETDFFAASYRLSNEVIETDEKNKYMIYRVYGTVSSGEFDTYYLVGERNGNVLNASVNHTDKWTETEKIEFLKNLFIRE